MSGKSTYLNELASGFFPALCAHPVLRMYYNQAQSSQEPKRGIFNTKVTKVVLQASTIQPGTETRAFPVLKSKVVLQASTIQPGAETKHFQN